MPQEPQPVDLEELTRLYDKYEVTPFHGASRTLFFVAISDAFPALRDELLQYRSGAVKQIVSEINKQVDDSVALRKENAEMRDELVRLRERDKNAEAKQRRAMLKNISIRRQLDEAKGLLRTWHAVSQNTELGVHIAEDTTAFLASLAGSCNNCNDTGTGTFAGDPCHVCKPQQQEQPTQREACLHNWQLSQGAVVYKCTKCGDKTTTPPQEVEGGEG